MFFASLHFPPQFLLLLSFKLHLPHLFLPLLFLSITFIPHFPSLILCDVSFMSYTARTLAHTQTHTHHNIPSCYLHCQPCSRLPPCPEAVSQWQYVQCVKPIWVLWCHSNSMNMQIIDDMSMSINGNIHYQNNNLDLEGGNVSSAWVCQTACQQVSESLISCELFKVLNPSSLPPSHPSYLPFFLSLLLTTFHPLISWFAFLPL